MEEASSESSSTSSFSQKIKSDYSIVNKVQDESMIGFYNNSGVKAGVAETPEQLVQNLLINTKFKIDSKL